MKFVKRVKTALIGMAVAVTAAVTPMVASAEATANDAVVKAMTSTANDMVATGTAIIPVALTVIGLSLVVIFGIKMFKRISGRG